MGNVSSQTPSLFDAPPPVAAEAAPAKPEPAKELKGAGQIAKDFVRWCCNVGDRFRNSPDVTNLRYWANKTKVKIKEREEAEILESARPLFLKRIEQLVRKSESGSESPN